MKKLIWLALLLPMFVHAQNAWDLADQAQQAAIDASQAAQDDRISDLESAAGGVPTLVDANDVVIGVVANHHQRFRWAQAVVKATNSENILVEAQPQLIFGGEVNPVFYVSNDCSGPAYVQISPVTVGLFSLQQSAGSPDGMFTGDGTNITILVGSSHAPAGSQTNFNRSWICTVQSQSKGVQLGVKIYDFTALQTPFRIELQ